MLKPSGCEWISNLAIGAIASLNAIVSNKNVVPLSVQVGLRSFGCMYGGLDREI